MKLSAYLKMWASEIEDGIDEGWLDSGRREDVEKLQDRATEAAALEAEVERLADVNAGVVADLTECIGHTKTHRDEVERLTKELDGVAHIAESRRVTLAPQIKRAQDAEAEVSRLRTLEALVAEAGRVEFRNDLPGLYPLAVWLPGKPNVHPMTWGATLDMMNQHGGRVTPEMIAHALEKLREAVAEEDADNE